MYLHLYPFLKLIPNGQVATYGDLARFFGLPNHSRYIGKLLNQNKQPEKYPCYKVVKSSGELGGYAYGLKSKVQKLTELGLQINNQKIINLTKHRWQPKFTNYFLAIPLSKAEESKLQKLQNKIQAELKDTSFLSWQKPQTAHLTLQFFGNVNFIDLASIVAQIGHLENRPQAKLFDLSQKIQFANLDYFKLHKKGGVGYFKCQKNCIEAQKLKSSLNFLNPHFSKKFIPHLTLFRIKNPAQFKAHQKLIEEIVKYYSFSLDSNLPRLYTAVESQHQTPLVDFNFRLT